MTNHPMDWLQMNLPWTILHMTNWNTSEFLSSIFQVSLVKLPLFIFLYWKQLQYLPIVSSTVIRYVFPRGALITHTYGEVSPIFLVSKIAESDILGSK